MYQFKILQRFKLNLRFFLSIILLFTIIILIRCAKDPEIELLERYEVYDSYGNMKGYYKYNNILDQLEFIKSSY